MIETVMIVGQKWLAAELLQLCLDLRLQVLAAAPPVIDDRLASLASRHGIPVVVAPDQLLACAVPDGVDLILCAHAYCYVTAAARARARLGALGYHPSLLPKYKGRDAIQQTLASGDRLAGGSLYWLDDGWDTGSVAAQQSCVVAPTDTAQTLWQRQLAPIGLQLFEQFLLRGI